MPVSKIPVRGPIPAPAWSRSKVSSGSMEELRQTMGWEAAKFNEFRKYVQTTVRSMDLDLKVGPDEQAKGQWKKLVAKCTQAFPPLVTDFEDVWPVEIYFRKHRFNYLRNLRQMGRESPHENSQKNKRKAAVVIESASDNDEGFVAAPTPRPCKKPRDAVSKPTQDKGNTTRTNQVATRREQVQEPTRTSASATATRAPASTSQNTNSTAVEHIKYAPCVLCGHIPDVPREHKAALTDFLSVAYSEEIAEDLTTAGITTDHAFRVLLRLNRTNRDKFLQGLTGMSPIHRAIVGDMFDQYVEEAKARDGKVPGMKDERRLIVKPSLQVLQELSSPKCDYMRVKQEMRVPTEQEYFDIVRAVEAQVANVLDVAPFEQQKKVKLQEAIKLICKAQPIFSQYEEYWPLLVLIKRRLASAGGVQGGNNEREHQCPLQNNFPLSKVPRTLAALLQAHEMEELGPAFLCYLGMNSDDAFKQIFTSEKLQRKLFNEKNMVARAPVRLTEFQRMMMQCVLADGR